VILKITINFVFFIEQCVHAGKTETKEKIK